jgi:hypothetical protein
MTRYKLAVSPCMSNGIPYLKKAEIERGLEVVKEEILLFEFDSPVSLVMFLGMHKDILTFNTFELKRFIKEYSK